MYAVGEQNNQDFLIQIQPKRGAGKTKMTNTMG